MQRSSLGMGRDKHEVGVSQLSERSIEGPLETDECLHTLQKTGKLECSEFLAPGLGRSRDKFMLPGRFQEMPKNTGY